MRHVALRIRAILYRTRWILLCLFAWFAVGFLVFRWIRGLGWMDALLSAFYIEVQSDIWGQGYAFWGQTILFGVFVGLLLRETLENYAERCRLMAGFVKDHTIIIGYTHLGMRLVDHCIQRKLPYVLIEKNRDLVDDLLRKGEPIVVDDAKSKDALPSANIKDAKRLIIVSNNIETALVVIKNARDENAKCKISVRCDGDHFIGVLEKLGADHIYSTSLAAFNELSKTLED